MDVVMALAGRSWVIAHLISVALTVLDPCSAADQSVVSIQMDLLAHSAARSFVQKGIVLALPTCTAGLIRGMKSVRHFVGKAVRDHLRCRPIMAPAGRTIART